MWRTKLALRNLSTAKLRSILTTLGVIIGVAFIVTTMVVGSSGETWLNSQAFGKGSNLILLSTGKVYSNGGYSISPTPVFGNDTVAAIKSVSGVNSVYPAGEVFPFTVVTNGTKSIVSLPLGFADSALLNATGVDFIAGSSHDGGLILSNDTAHILNVTVGSDVTLLLPGEIATETWKVTGIFVPPSSSTGNLFVLSAYLPINAWKGDYDEILVKTNGIASIASVQANVLDAARRTTTVSTIGLSVEAFSLQTLFSGALTADRTILNFFLFAGVLALIIGGIGVTNVMLMSLKERIREIGILKAIGTSDSSVFTVYMIESAFIGLIGGAIGLGIGLLVSIGVLKTLLAVPFAPSVISLVIGPLAGASIGIGFGVYPAILAYRMSPGEAVRWEW